MNYAPSIPLPESVRDYFSHNVVAPIDISIDLLACRRSKQAALHPLALVLLMLAYRFIIQETALARIAFLGEDDGDSNQLCLVGEHVDEPRMREAHKLLIVALADIDLLLPVGIFADKERPYPLLNQQSDNSPGSCVQVVINPRCALVG